MDNFICEHCGSDQVIYTVLQPDGWCRACGKDQIEKLNIEDTPQMPACFNTEKCALTHDMGMCDKCR